MRLAASVARIGTRRRNKSWQYSAPRPIGVLALSERRSAPTAVANLRRGLKGRSFPESEGQLLVSSSTDFLVDPGRPN